MIPDDTGETARSPLAIPCDPEGAAEFRARRDEIASVIAAADHVLGWPVEPEAAGFYATAIMSAGYVKSSDFAAEVLEEAANAWGNDRDSKDRLTGWMWLKARVEGVRKT